MIRSSTAPDDRRAKIARVNSQLDGGFVMETFDERAPGRTAAGRRRKGTEKAIFVIHQVIRITRMTASSKVFGNEEVVGWVTGWYPYSWGAVTGSMPTGQRLSLAREGSLSENSLTDCLVKLRDLVSDCDSEAV